MSPSAHARLAEVAAAQHGAFSLAQALDAGLERHQVHHQVDAGRWVRLARGVLAVAGAPTTWDQRAMAALLARPDAVLAELAAGQAHGLVEAPLDQPTLFVPLGTSIRVPLGTARRRALPPDQRTLVRGLRVTSVARTLIDLSAVLPTTQLGKLVDDAIGGRRATVAELRSISATATQVQRTGREAVLAAAAIWEGIRPGSVGEVRLLRAIGEWGLPPLDRQIPVCDASGQIVARIDAGWAARQVGLEYDSIEWHGPARWLADEARHALLVDLGWTLLHVGARDLLPSSDLRLRLQRALSRAA